MWSGLKGSEDNSRVEEMIIFVEAHAKKQRRTVRTRAAFYSRIHGSPYMHNDIKGANQATWRHARRYFDQDSPPQDHPDLPDTLLHDLPRKIARGPMTLATILELFKARDDL